MAPSLVQTAHATGSSGTASATFGSNITPGNTVVAFIFCNGTSTVVATIETGSSADNWSEVTTGTGGTDVVYIYADPNTVGGSNTVTITYTPTSSGLSVVLAEITGVSASPVDQYDVGLNDGTSANSGTTITTTQASEIFVGVGFVSSGTATGQSSPWSSMSLSTTSVLGTQVVSSEQTTSYQVSASSSGENAALVVTLKAGSPTAPSIPQIMPGPTWLDIFKPGMPRPRPPIPPSGPYYGNLPNLSDVPAIQPGTTWIDNFKPGLRRPRPQVPATPPFSLNVHATGSMALAPLAISATGLSGTISATGSMALAPLAMSGSEAETFEATGSAAMPAMAMAATGTNQNAVPPGPVKLFVELNVNGVWTDISDYVYQRDNIVIARGKPDESQSGTANPAEMTLTLNNRDGRFSSQYPLSPYYPYLGRNVQMRLSAPATMPPPFDLTYRFWGEVSEWPPSWDPTGNDVYTQITVSGIFRRLTQSASLSSAMTRYLSMLATSPLAWWPAEDGASATQIASGLPTGLAMRWMGNPALASDSGFLGSAAAPACASASFNGDTGASGALPVASYASYTTAGTYHWTCPDNVTEVLGTAVGGGGPGGGYNGSQGGSGGGGGEQAQDSVPVTPGNVYTVVVGSGEEGSTSTFTGDSGHVITAHGGGAGDGVTLGTGGLGGTGSTNAVHFNGGAGAAGSGGSGSSGSTTPGSFITTTPGASDWEADSTISGSVTGYLWAGGGGGGSGAGGGSPNGGGGGAGGDFLAFTVSVTGGNSYSYTIGSGGSGGVAGNGQGGGASQFIGDDGTFTVHGGNPGQKVGTGGAPSGAGSTTSGGYGADGGTGADGGGGGGGGAGGLGGNGGNASGGGGGTGGNSGGLDVGGGDGANGGSHSDNGLTGGAPGGGGGGGGAGAGDGGVGHNGRMELYWTDETAPGEAAVGGGGGSSGGSASTGNNGATEAGGAVVAGGGPGGGLMVGSTFEAAPITGPGGGGGGFDSNGGPGNGADGSVVISYAASEESTGGVAANVLRFGLHIPSGGDTDNGVVAQMYTTGTISYVEVIYTSFTAITLAATTVAATNPNPGPVNVTVAGGTVTEIQVNGVNQGADSGTFEVPGSGTITVTYSVAPTTFTTAGVLGTTGYLTLSGYAGSGALLFTTGEVQLNADGDYLWVSAELQQVSTNVTYNLTALVQGGSEPISSGSGTYDGATLGNPFLVIMDPGEDMAFAWNQLLVLETYYAITDDASAFAAYAGETAATRITRLCGEQGISSSIIDATSPVTPLSDTTALMGPQTVDKLINLLQACEDADRGVMFEPLGFFGISYRSRFSLYIQTQALIAYYGQAELAQPMQPTEDDQLSRNDVTVTRLNGSSYEAIVETGPMSVNDPPLGIGDYTYSVTLDVQSDGQLPDTANWIAWVGTQSDLRYPAININLFRSEVTAIFDAVVAMDIGDYMQIPDPPFWLPAGTIDQLVYGYTETINAFVWNLEYNDVPEAPYEVMAVNESLIDTDGSVLNTGIGTADTSFAVFTSVPNAVWVDSTNDPGSFPFNIIVRPSGAASGEVMTVSGISGTGTTQTFTVERGINGIVMPHNVGEAVSVYQPGVIAM